ncbi:hypothetical protein ACHAWF_009236 [Thalassiosira exigua]
METAADQKNESNADVNKDEGEGNTRSRVDTFEVASVDQLPDAALVSISSFLPKLSRLLFAAAVTAPASSWEMHDYEVEPSEASKIIALAKCESPSLLNERSRSRETLCFGYSEYTLWIKLTDADVGAMLVCVDAARSLKVLKMRCCYHITGRGLSPLRGSTVLEQLILEPIPGNPPSIVSESEVIPILDSIVRKSDNSLTYMQLPNIWLGARSQALTQFLERYHGMMNDKLLACSECAETCQAANDHPWIENSESKYGSQNYICFDCNKQFCQECERTRLPGACCLCGEKACAECRKTSRCTSCNDAFCDNRSCGEHLVECEDCRELFCDTKMFSNYSCVARACNSCGRTRCFQCVPVATCEQCDNRTICIECADNVHNDVQHCPSCDEAFCVDCLSDQFRHGENSCAQCKSRIIPKLFDEIDSLRARNNRRD